MIIMKDLIDECGEDLSLLGYKCKDESQFGLKVCSLVVDSKEKAEKSGFEEGEYLVLNCQRLPFGESECLEYVSKYVHKSIKFLMKCSNLSKKSRWLIVGLGNPQILADSLGCKVLDYINMDIERNKINVYKFAPNIFVNTGINAYDVVSMLSVWLDIDGVILIDSLATSSIDRLGCSIQLNTAGITPGSAVNNLGKKIGKSTLGLPCISIGVPLMFFGDELGKKDLLLTPKDIHSNVEDLSLVIASAINEALIK